MVQHANIMARDHLTSRHLTTGDMRKGRRRKEFWKLKHNEEQSYNVYQSTQNLDFVSQVLNNVALIIDLLSVIDGKSTKTVMNQGTLIHLSLAAHDCISL